MEVNEWEKVLDLKLEPVKSDVRYLADRFDRFITTTRWVAAVILVPLMFFVMDKVF